MANPRHVELALNHAALAEFRARHPLVRLDLSNANLEEAHLSGDFTAACFDGARLKKASLPVQLRGASFDGANLRLAKLNGASGAEHEFDRTDASFQHAHMTDANLRQANFTGANFTGADMRGAFLERAILRNAVFSGTNLLDASFDGAELGNTLFDAVDLSRVRGLERAVHVRPSAITLSTIARSGGRIPQPFLAGACADMPGDVFQRLCDSIREVPYTYRSCFISYAHADVAFAETLEKRLRKEGVGVWRDAASLRAGEPFEAEIQRAIERNDHLLVVLSASALKSQWVMREVEMALRRDAPHYPSILIPVRIDDAVLKSRRPLWKQVAVNHIIDFRSKRRTIKRDALDALDALLRALQRT